MTAALILKPDFGETFARGLARLAGTLAGLALATALTAAIWGSLAARITLILVLTFALRSVGRANYGLAVSIVSALVVVLLSFYGAQAGATIEERAVDTLIGGAVALLLYTVWPTWERSQTPTVLADLLDAYRAYFDAVAARYVDPRAVRDADELESCRVAARLARSNAEASIDRLRNEPGRFTEILDASAGLLANSHRFVHAAMRLEAELHNSEPPTPPPALKTFVRDVDGTLAALARALRERSSQLGALRDLRAEQRALAKAARDETRLALIAIEADTIVNSLNTMAELLRGTGALAGGASRGLGRELDFNRTRV